MTDEIARRCLYKFEDYKVRRATWETQWQEATDLVHPNSSHILKLQYPGTPRTRLMFDGTAVMARGECAAALQSYVMPSNERWFNLSTHDPRLLYDRDCLIWLESVSDLIFWYYSLPSVYFNPAVSEIFNDLVGYGTACLYQDWDMVRQCPSFKSIQMLNLFVDEDYNGRIDTNYVTQEWTARQAYQIFGDKLPQKLKDQLDKPSQNNRYYKFLHAVEPRETYRRGSKLATDMKYASYWICLDTKETIEESGYTSLPYSVPRWRKIPQETYGHGPSLDAMPDIKMINALARIMVVAGEKAIDPVILIPDDGFISAMTTVPGQLVRYDSTFSQFGEMVKPLEHKGNLQYGIEFLNRLSDKIERAFYIDFIRSETKKERQSVPETLDKRDEMLRMLASILGRQETELQGQVIARTFNLLLNNKILPVPPMKLRTAKLKIEFVSQAARAQSSSKMAPIMQLLQDLVPLGQISNGSVYDIIDTDAVVQQYVNAKAISQKIIRLPRDVAQIRQGRQQQQEMQQAGQTGQQIAGAAKDLATAHSMSQQPMGVQ